MKLILPALGGLSWLGGLNYVRNLVSAIRSADARVHIAIAGTPDNVALLGVSPDEIILPEKLRGFNRRFTASWFLQRILISRAGFPARLAPNGRHFTDRIGFSLAAGTHPKNLPVIQWIPDFQHVGRPDFFSRKEIRLRTEVYRRFARHAPAVVLSSQNAREHFAALYPGEIGKAHVIHFVPAIPESAFVADPTSVTHKYGITEPFFYLPNQFWRHKNHRVVVEALALLAKRGKPPLVVCSGATEDYRAPAHFPQLVSRIRSLQLTERFRILGVVPYWDMLMLMRAARGVLNPSHFEGWSTTVEEAKALGRPIALSDIPVHREQAPENSVYFDPDSVEEVAQTLDQFFENARAAPATPASLVARQQRFGEQFLFVCSAVKQP